MELLTEEIKEKLRETPIGSTESQGKGAEVIVKFFNPCGSGTWLITEGEELPDGDWLLFGYCHIWVWEWGTVLFSELESLKLPYGLKIERDLYSKGNVEKLSRY